MSEKYLIFGATGSIGSSLAEQLVNSGNSVHLVGRNESETKNISEKLGCAFTIADVLEDGFTEKIKNDISELKFTNSSKINSFPFIISQILLGVSLLEIFNCPFPS